MPYHLILIDEWHLMISRTFLDNGWRLFEVAHYGWRAFMLRRATYEPQFVASRPLSPASRSAILAFDVS